MIGRTIGRNMLKHAKKCMETHTHNVTTQLPQPNGVTGLCSVPAGVFVFFDQRPFSEVFAREALDAWLPLDHITSVESLDYQHCRTALLGY